MPALKKFVPATIEIVLVLSLRFGWFGLVVWVPLVENNKLRENEAKNRKATTTTMRMH